MSGSTPVGAFWWPMHDYLSHPQRVAMVVGATLLLMSGPIASLGSTSAESAPKYSSFACQTFIGDGRGLLIRVRELATYPIIASAVATGANVEPIQADDLNVDWGTFEGDWDSSLDHQIDARLPGHAYLHTGSHERTITVHAQAYWRHGSALTACVSAEQSYEVGPDYEAFISLDYVHGAVYNELSPGNPTAGLTRALRISDELSVFSLPLLIDAEWRDYHYQHTSNVAAASTHYCQAAPTDSGCVTLVGHVAYERLLGFGQTFIPSKVSIDQDADFHLGLKMLDPHVYIGAGYSYRRIDDIGSPFFGFGFGIDKLPSLDHSVSFEASGWQYSNMRATDHGPSGGRYGALSGAVFTPKYNVLTYRAGVTFTTRIGRYFWELGELGDRGFPNIQAPSGFSHHAVFIGGGWRL